MPDLTWKAHEDRSREGDPSHDRALPGASVARTATTDAPRPTISIVVATLNSGATLERCLRSVAAQTLAAIELLVIDGGSTDGTLDLLRRYQHAIAWCRSEPDRGVADAWNKGVERCRGAWLLFLGGDDYLPNETVLAEAFERLAILPPEVRIAYGSVRLETPEGVKLGTLGRPWSEVAHEFRRTMAIPHQGVFHHRSLFEEHGGFDSSFAIAADYELLLRELDRSTPHFLGNVMVAVMQTGGLSSDPDNTHTMSREFARARRRHGLVGTAGFWRQLLRIWIRQRVHRWAGPRAAHAMTALVRRLEGRPDLPESEP